MKCVGHWTNRYLNSFMETIIYRQGTNYYTFRLYGTELRKSLAIWQGNRINVWNSGQEYNHDGDIKLLICMNDERSAYLWDHPEAAILEAML